MARRQRIKVRVVQLGRGDLVFRWTDRRGKQRQRKADTKSRRKAERLAGDLEAELNSLQSHDVQTSVAIVEYDRLKACGLAAKTRLHWATVKRHLESFGMPKHLGDFDEHSVSELTQWFTASGVSSSTIASYLKRVRAFLNWCATQRMIARAPHVPINDQSSMRGRPLIGEEIERLLASIESVVGQKHAAGWRRLVRGLLLTSLRLNEGLILSWDNPRTMHIVGLERSTPVIRIPHDTDKGGRAFDLPLSPKAIKFLRRCPIERRQGRVFPVQYRGGRVTDEDLASVLIRRAGVHAGIVVSHYEDGRKKFASAQDLRVTFATRLAKRGVPVQHLHRIMRHKDLRTTMRYYVSLQTDDLAKAMRGRPPRKIGDLGGDTNCQRSS